MLQASVPNRSSQRQIARPFSFNSEAGDDDRAFPASTALHATREDRLGSLPFRSRRTETKEPPLDPSGSKNKSIFLTWPGSTARVMPQAG